MVAIYHCLHPSPTFCTQDFWRSFLHSDWNGELPPDKTVFCKELADKGILIQSIDEDSSSLRLTKKALEKKLSQTKILYLILAQDCNLNCHYCPVPEIAQGTQIKRLSFSSAKKGIDLWLSHVNDNYDPNTEYFIIFYGGEPLLNKTLFISLAEYIREQQVQHLIPENISLLLSTNGLLIDDEILATIKSRKIAVMIAIDGAKPAHDSSRVYEDGTPTYDSTIRVIEKLRSEGIIIYCSTSLTPEVISDAQDFRSTLLNLGIEKFGLNYLKGKGLKKYSWNTSIYIHEAVELIMKNFFQKSDISEYQVEKKIYAYENQDFFPVDCTCYGNQLVILSDGSISNCPFAQPKISNVDSCRADFRIWNSTVVQDWRKRLPLFKDVLNLYKAKSLCGGGCAWNALENYGDVLAEDEFAQEFTTRLFNELIWTPLNKSHIYGL